MKLLFIDDSRQKDQKDGRKAYIGCGGFCIDATEVNFLKEEFYSIREKFNIPIYVELKWSPDKDHFINKEFQGKQRKAI